MSGNFGFDVGNVFGSARKGTKRKTKRKKDSMDMMMEGSGLGIDTFSLADPNIDALSLGSDFGSQIGSRAGTSNGRGGGFLDIIGQQQRLPSRRVTGKGRIASGKSRAKVGRKRSSPLQSRTGSSFGNVDQAFAGNVIGNIRGAKKRISAFRDKRKKTKSKTQSTQDRPALPPPPAQQLRQPERLALPPPRASSLGARPSESGSSAIQRLREAEERRSAT